MPTPNPLRPQPDNRLAFLQGFLQRPKEVGSIVPSSRFLERRVVRTAGVEQAHVVVELGPGTGGTTRALLRSMKPTSKLLAIEVNKRFVDLLAAGEDQRLIAHHGSAAAVEEALAKHDLPSPDVILSGIPFSTMPEQIGLDIIQSVYDALPPGGVFLAYQVRDRVELLGRQIFGPARKQMELRNVPPMRLYRWVK
jgi:phospholipid N-methyltransferase